jgi:hypothetical protein
VVAVVAVLALAAGGIWLARPKDSGPDPRAWEKTAQAAFKPLVDDVPDLIRGAREWQAGQRPTDAFAQQVRNDLADFVRTRQRVAALQPSPKAKQARGLYEHSAQLYVEVGRIYEVMVTAGPGDVRDQLDLLARRIRELADRVYDRGHAALAPYLDERQSPDVEVRLPEEVPIWPAEGLAAGPPLADAPPPAAASSPLRQASRPQQSVAAWARDVQRAAIPSDAALGVAIRAFDRDRLADLARRFVAAAELLRQAPDPKGQRDRSAVLRLGLLVDADAARAGQAATFLEGEQRQNLNSVGSAIADVGRSLVRETRA